MNRLTPYYERYDHPLMQAAVQAAKNRVYQHHATTIDAQTKCANLPAEQCEQMIIRRVERSENMISWLAIRILKKDQREQAGLPRKLNEFLINNLGMSNEFAPRRWKKKYGWMKDWIAENYGKIEPR